jgi:hypothetical protein
VKKRAIPYTYCLAFSIITHEKSSEMEILYIPAAATPDYAIYSVKSPFSLDNTSLVAV